jgi:site-specific recombinase XerC
MAKGFLRLLRSRGKTASRATVADVDRFILQLSERVSRRSLADRGSSLRSFLRYLRTTGKLPRDLAREVMTPRIRPAERPPRAFRGRTCGAFSSQFRKVNHPGDGTSPCCC